MESSPSIEKVLYDLSEHFNPFSRFKGLNGWKEKFHLRWESRYLISLGRGALPEGVGLVRADSGDRPIDYFKPGS